MSTLSLEELNAIHQIREQLSLYCRAMDRIDDELALSLWTDDAILDYADIFHGTAREFVERTHQRHVALVATRHRITNQLIRVSGDEAVSEADGRITLVDRDEQGFLVRESLGRYLDQWVLRDGRWLIRRRQYHRDFALFSRPDVVVGTGQRSRDDASYELFPTEGFSSDL